MKALIPLLLLCFVQISCTGQQKNHATSQQTTPSVTTEIVFSDIDIPFAQKLIAQSKDLVIIDVRTPDEIANGKIANALEMDIKSPEFKSKLEALDKEGQYMVYCHAGGRSTSAMNMMKEMGFKQVYNMNEGFRAWPKQ